MGRVLGGIIIVLVILGGVYWWTQSPKPAAAPAAPKNATDTQPAGTPDTSSAMATPSEEIEVTGDEFAFTPSTIKVKEGDTVKITFKNTGKYPHNLTLSGGMNLATKTVNPGESDSITFTADKTGSFPFECTVDSHADKGMKGTLTVE